VIALFLSTAWANQWDGHSADVKAERVIAASPDAVTDVVRDLAAWRDLVPAACATSWELQERTVGVGARGRVTYTIGSMRRTLTVAISKDEPGRVLELDHAGKKGFFTQVVPVATDTGSTVLLTTFLEPPPWPFKGTFFRNVQPAWVACHARTLDAIADRLARAAIPGPPTAH
jgi:hypothetical protein